MDSDVDSIMDDFRADSSDGYSPEVVRTYVALRVALWKSWASANYQTRRRKFALFSSWRSSN